MRTLSLAIFLIPIDKTINARLRIGYESSCEFCAQSFSTESEKNLHIFEHFAQEVCTGCDQRLVRIGASLFVLHTRITCVKANNNLGDSHQNLSPAIEECSEYPPNEVFIKEEMLEPSVSLQTDHTKSIDQHMQNEERLPQETESIFFDGSKTDIEPDISLDQHSYEIDNNSSSDENLLSSEKVTIDGRLVKCQIRSCGRVVRKKHLATHLKELHGYGFQCNIEKCRRFFPHQSRLQKHMLKHEKNDIYDENQKQFICNTCNKSISSRQALKRHIRLSHRPKDELSLETYTCDYCQIEIRGRPLLRRHMKLNHDPDYKRPECFECKKTFLDIQKLQQHNRAVHLDERFICSWCGKSLKSEYNLKTHLYLHTGETPYKCSFDGCSKAFRSKDTMARHQFTHTGEKQFKCDIDGCDRLFLFKNDMNKHKRRVHMKQSESKNYICSVCGEGFSKSYLLRDHGYKHSGEKPHKCKVKDCGKAFRTASLLSNHTRYHSNLKKYKCDQVGCEKAYAYDVDLKRHKYGAHGIWWKKFPCPICENRIFPENKLLNRHMKARHGLLDKTTQ